MKSIGILDDFALCWFRVKPNHNRDRWIIYKTKNKNYEILYRAFNPLYNWKYEWNFQNIVKNENISSLNN